MQGGGVKRGVILWLKWPPPSPRDLLPIATEWAGEGEGGGEGASAEPMHPPPPLLGVLLLDFPVHPSPSPFLFPPPLPPPPLGPLPHANPPTKVGVMQEGGVGEGRGQGQLHG
nr:hypothetical protein [Morchella crassipes]